MTIHEAVARLIVAKPGVSFKIELNIWSHVNGLQKIRSPLDIEWRIWDADLHKSVTGPNLQVAVEAALADSSLNEVQAALDSPAVEAAPAGASDDCPF